LALSIADRARSFVKGFLQVTERLLKGLAEFEGVKIVLAHLEAILEPLLRRFVETIEEIDLLTNESVLPLFIVNIESLQEAPVDIGQGFSLGRRLDQCFVAGLTPGPHQTTNRIIKARRL